MISLRPLQGPASIDALWLIALRRYFAFAIPAHMVWEVAQLPLYTIWHEDPPGRIAFAVLHCTGGDALIAGASLLGALLLFGTARWPNERYIAVAAPVVLAGVVITIFGEWYHTEFRNNWAYAELMPRLPWIGTGLSPLLQWLVIPIAAFWWAYRRQATQFKPIEEPS